eukprot:scaffold17217_cov134-Isochrysis_galbana.AAC.6
MKGRAPGGKVKGGGGKGGNASLPGDSRVSRRVRPLALLIFKKKIFFVRPPQRATGRSQESLKHLLLRLWPLRQSPPPAQSPPHRRRLSRRFRVPSRGMAWPFSHQLELLLHERCNNRCSQRGRLGVVNTGCARAGVSRTSAGPCAAASASAALSRSQ